MSETVKIFGERNTSTNALRKLIESNSDSRIAPSVTHELDPTMKSRLTLARKLRLPVALQERMIDSVFAGQDPLHTWKHTTTRFDDISCFKGVHVVFCVRHPASWILGLFRRPYQIHKPRAQTLGEFLDLRWKTVGRERLGRAKTSATELYNTKAKAFADLQARLDQIGVTHSIVRHEDFAVDQADVFSKIAPFLANPSAQFEPLRTSTKDPSKTPTYYRNFYGNEEWRAEIDTASMARINAEIDWSVAQGFGYS